MRKPRLAVCYIVHDDDYFLAASIDSFKAAGSVYAFVGRVPWHEMAARWDYLQSRAAAAKINFYTVNGDILGQETVGGARWDYLTDALGSIVATQDSTSAVGNTYRYKPYGAQLAKTGTSADPAFGWVGSLSYRPTGTLYSEQYVRARHYGTTQARWTSLDPLWPQELAYGYVGATPTKAVDRGGLHALGLASGYKQHPPDCSKRGHGCKPVWFTCNKDRSAKLAVYCEENDDPPPHSGCDSMGDFCRKDGGQLGPPVFPPGSKVCIYGQHGTFTRTIDDCGCGPRRGHKPAPNNWMDLEGGDCTGFDDGWRCV